jgi:hypothetical protein
MKDDPQLNKYYGVNYRTWFDDVLLTYTELNAQLGALQNYEITSHSTVIAERSKENSEKKNDYAKLEAEYFELLRAYVDAKVDARFNELKEAGNLDSRVKVVLDEKKITAQFRMIAADSELVFDKESFTAKYNEMSSYYTTKFPGDAANSANDSVVEIVELENYESKYSFFTESDAFDKNYKVTNYTLDNNKVVVVTYSNGEDTVRFVLNYNIYTVDVRIDGVVYTLDKYAYARIDG